MTSSLNGGHVERRRSASAKWDVWRICRVPAVFGNIFAESELKSGIDRRRMCHGRCGGTRTRRRWDHHSAGDSEKKAEISDVAIGSIEPVMEGLAERGKVGKVRLISGYPSGESFETTSGDGLVSQRNEGPFSSFE